jgi:hypothetical protein
MPMDASGLKSKIKQTIINGFKKEFSDVGGDGGLSQKQWTKIAEAISGIAMDIVAEIQSNAEVDLNIPVMTVGSPAAQSGQSVGPGKIK